MKSNWLQNKQKTARFYDMLQCDHLSTLQMGFYDVSLVSLEYHNDQWWSQPHVFHLLTSAVCPTGQILSREPFWIDWQYVSNSIVDKVQIKCKCFCKVTLTNFLLLKRSILVYNVGIIVARKCIILLLKKKERKNILWSNRGEAETKSVGGRGQNKEIMCVSMQ